MGGETDGERGDCSEHGVAICAGKGEVDDSCGSGNGWVVEGESDEGVEFNFCREWVEQWGHLEIR
jgi:hypothetical protein